MMQNRFTNSVFLFVLVILTMGLLAVTPASFADPTPRAVSVIPNDALTTVPVGGMERTQATSTVVPVTHQPFTNALRVVIRANSAETNTTQLTIPIATAVEKDDTLLATVYLRGTAADHTAPGQIALLFEKASEPWTKSLTQAVIGPKDPQTWKRVVVPFRAVESYKPGEAMVSLRLAFGPQTIEVGGLSVVSYGKTVSAERLVALAAQRNPLGNVRLSVDRSARKQTLTGFGGNFCQPRYGSTQAIDPVGQYNLDHLTIAQARVGIPLNSWTPERGTYRDTAQAHAALLLMQLLSRRHIPIIGTVWEGPLWMLGGQPEQSGRILPPDKYTDCIEAIAQFLVTARDHYRVNVAYFSFNEPDYGVNFRFTSEQTAAFIAQAGPRFRALGLKTRFLVGDTSGGTPAVAYAEPLLANKALAPYLGPFAFHCWDVLEASDNRYQGIAALGKKYGKPIWCTEVGHDAQLWQKANPWTSWENALRTALAYARTLRLTGASVMDYWTYEDNYPIVSSDGRHPYPVFAVIRQMGNALPGGSTIVAATADNEDLSSLATIGPKPGQFSLLLIDPIGAGSVTVSGLPPGAVVSVTVSTETTQSLTSTKRSRVDPGGHLVIDLPTRSVATVQSQTRE